MSRVLLVHWNATELEDRAARLRRAGHNVVPFSTGGGEGLRALRENPPDAVVIDLDRLPSQGKAVATFLRQQKATRHVPLVFVDGDPDKVAGVRALLPDAVYTDWDEIRGALRGAIADPPSAPIVPGTMATYQGRPLPQKLGIRVGATVTLLGAPRGFEASLRPLPDRVRLARHARARPQTLLLFVKSHAELARRFPAAARALADGGALWVAWPKQSSGLASDLTLPSVRAFGLGRGFVDYKICAIDATWLGLCFTRRRR